ncbi:unnamed protein product [Bodo saltans]|uniref:Uncharacterized protein n=1 Tax=Bodo saltans TaxID=75058 RepID=A0A0S4ILY2_BODSA|nr:unnamed protein product [Bodo saltans]|eukprot:CUE72302.1 unnamed protein product [Bodo saltans]
MSSTQQPGDHSAAVATAQTKQQLIDPKFDFTKRLLECAIDSGLLAVNPARDVITWHAPLHDFVAAPGVNISSLTNVGFNLDVVSSLQKLCEVMSKAEVTEGADKLAEDFFYVTDSPPSQQPMTSLAEVVEDPDVKWKGMARRLLHMCGFWSRRQKPQHKDRKFFDKMEVGHFDFFHEQLVKKLILDVDVCDPAQLSQRLEDLAMQHKCEGSTFFKLTFIATSTTAATRSKPQSAW